MTDVSIMLTPHDVRRLSVEALRDPRTVRAAYFGRPMKPLALTAIIAAAERLCLPLPIAQKATGAPPTKEKAPDAKDSNDDTVCAAAAQSRRA